MSDDRRILKNCPVSCFADEIDSSVDRQMALMEELGIGWVEFRSGDGKGVADYTEAEAETLMRRLEEKKIRVSAVGSPIGKINISDDFAPHLASLEHVAKLAKIWNTSYIRCFSFFLPEGEVPPNPAGESGLPREITRETAESSMAVALTQAAIRLGITPVDYYAMPGIRESFLRSLDPNLFRRTGPEQCRYLLVGSGRGDSWTLSIKRKNEIDFLWTKTITKIKGN